MGIKRQRRRENESFRRQSATNTVESTWHNSGNASRVCAANRPFFSPLSFFLFFFYYYFRDLQANRRWGRRKEGKEKAFRRFTMFLLILPGCKIFKTLSGIRSIGEVQNHETSQLKSSRLFKYYKGVNIFCQGVIMHELKVKTQNNSVLNFKSIIDS